MKRGPRGGRIAAALSAPFALLIAPLYAPQLLAFPYRAESAIGTVRSDRPIDPAALARVASRTGALLAASPISRDDERRPVFLTDGGWRWSWLALSSRGSFAFTRPVTRAVVVNASDLARDTVENGAPVGGRRPLHAVLAHEFTHGILRRRYGPVAMAFKPQWLIEGYADHVAGNSSLTAADVARLERRGAGHPALPYYYGRRKVEATLRANGGDVDALFGGG